MPVAFEWDEGKNRRNIAKHHLDFQDARRVFDGPLLTAVDQRQEYGETRWVGIGLIDGRVVVVVFTEPRPGLIRILSLRKALTNEERKFRDALRNRLGSS
jgi:uncharacterized protein